MDATAQVFSNALLPDLIRVDQLARVLHRSPATIRRLIREKRLPGSKVGAVWVIERGALLRALASSSAHPRANLKVLE